MTVVVEAGEPSGLADHRELRREPRARRVRVPGRVDLEPARGLEPPACGTARCVIRGAEDVLDELFGVGGGAIRAAAQEAARGRRWPPAQRRSTRRPRRTAQARPRGGRGRAPARGDRAAGGAPAGRRARRAGAARAARPRDARRPRPVRARRAGLSRRASSRPVSASAASVPRVLAIAGSDSGGGAGIQADLKALAACGVHGMTAITAITAQNTVGVRSVHPVPPETIVDQVRAVVEDIGVDAVKIGMLGTVETIAAVEAGPGPGRRGAGGARPRDGRRERGGAARRGRAHVAAGAPARPSGGGHAEPSRGSGHHRSRRGGPRRRSRAGRRSPARSIVLGPAAVVVTGGHGDEASDVFFDGERARGDTRRAPPRRGRARLRLHALVRPGGAPRARLRSARGGARGAAGRLRGRPRRPARRSGRAPARWTRSASRGGGARGRDRSDGRMAFDIIDRPSRPPIRRRCPSSSSCA